MTAAAVLEVRPAGGRRPPPDAADLVATLEHARALVEKAQARAVALADLDAIDLPDATPASADDQAHIRAIASLYLAAQLEAASLLPAVEVLAGLAVSGGVTADLGPASTLIADFWRQRNERFDEKERRAFFARLLGSVDADRTANAAFENLMIDLCESLYRLDERSIDARAAGPRAQTLVRLAARNLGQNLLDTSDGMTAFAAREILRVVQSAVAILQQDAVQHAFGARSLWGTVRALSLRYMRRETDVASYVTRGKSGVIVLAWLADALAAIDGGMPVVTPGHPVIAAAIDWLQASLTIREAASRARG